MTNLQLAAKVEAAEGPDRELGLEISIACGMETPHLCPTASVDAAMMLVPEGWRYILDKRPYAEMRKDGYRAVVWHAPLVPYEKMGVWAATPALALTAASLRARSEVA